MNIGKAFSYPFDDPDWLKKIGLIALVSLIPILGTFMLLGWMLTITKRVIQRDPRPLPDLDFSNQLILGLKGFVVSFVYTLPVAILTAPISIVNSYMTSSSSYSNSGDSTTMILSIVSICCGCLGGLFGLVVAFLLPAAMANMVTHNDSIGAGFDFKTVFALVRAAPVAYLLVVLINFVSGLIAALGLILCIIGVVVTGAYAQAIMGHMYGQAYNESTAMRPAAAV